MNALNGVILNGAFMALLREETQNVQVRSPSEMSAQDLILRAVELVEHNNPQDNLAAERLLKPALEKFPENSKLWCARAMMFLVRCSAMWNADVLGDINRGHQAALNALKFDGQHNWPYDMLSFFDVYLGKREQAEFDMERSTTLDPYHSNYRSGRAAIPTYLGRFEDALHQIDLAIEYHSNHEISYLLNRGRGLYLLGEDDRAIFDLEQVERVTPDLSNIRLLLAAAYDSAGRTDDARGLISAHVDVTLWMTIERTMLVTPYPQVQRTRFVKFLRRYDVPEV